ncbi:uncharacterized protein EDB91DRAFT_1248586 [Suillus paluster]|uniref:uncharacterized protein n=1 Tax=Suillus paluster TaxID=48578 RepID=UPI001B863241|nr:uncharacterized protein EDB91DRAFT_1248586 [Suillus paluster]KAG1739829.1 hypothetical protein EDB91DRAFT_1248586 [Suillus paluster]
MAQVHSSILLAVTKPYEIVPQFKRAPLYHSQESLDIIALVVEVKHRPVFFMEIQPPASFIYDSRREEADEQMRKYFMDFAGNPAIPILHGVSAFGTRLSFYECDSATRIFQPELIEAHPPILADVAPITRWNCDVLQWEGVNRLMDVVNKVKEMCARL